MGLQHFFYQIPTERHVCISLYVGEMQYFVGKMFVDLIIFSSDLHSQLQVHEIQVTGLSY